MNRSAPTPSTSSASAHLCPLCAQPNQCAMAKASGADPQSCWCMHQPVARSALERLPTAQRGQCCICPHCAQSSDSDLGHRQTNGQTGR